VRLSRRRIAYSATMSSQFGHDIAFRCPHCGARYVVSYTELPIADSGSDYCECCKRRMLQWNSALQPRYRLVERPSENTHNASRDSGAPRTQLPPQHSQRESGPGIDPERLDSIFGVFFTTKSHGMGLGLAICRMIIEHHGGQLTASSDGKNGSLFQFVLPIEFTREKTH
jgi:hypothetical protein